MDLGLSDRACVERFGRLDVLVNNPGGNAVIALQKLRDAECRAVASIF